MYVEFQIVGRYTVPDGTIAEPGTRKLFRLPGGQVVSVHPVIELETRRNADDHRDLSYSEGFAMGISFDLYDRTSILVSDDDPDLGESGSPAI